VPVIRRKDRWSISIHYRDLDGLRRRFRRDAQVQTKTGAEAEHRRLLVQLSETGTLAPQKVAPTPSFAELVQLWRELAKPQLKPSTSSGYESAIAAHLLPVWGDLLADQIGFESVRRLDSSLAQAGRAVQTRANVQIAVRAILRCAADAGHLPEMPKLPKLPVPGRRVNPPMHLADVERVLGRVTHRMRVAFELAAWAGLRAGEIRGLRWSDIELDRATLTVRRSVHCGIETSPKSGHARLVPIPARLVEFLRARLALAPKTSPWAAVAPSSPAALSAAFRRAWPEAGLSFHSLRHFYASELSRRGASARAIQLLLGHANLATTQRYCDLAESDLSAAVALFTCEPTARQRPKTRRRGKRASG
jgi:integrase